MKRKLENKKRAKFTPSENKKEMERKKLIQEKRIKTMNINKRNVFIDSLYKKYDL